MKAVKLILLVVFVVVCSSVEAAPRGMLKIEAVDDERLHAIMDRVDVGGLKSEMTAQGYHLDNDGILVGEDDRAILVPMTSAEDNMLGAAAAPSTERGYVYYRWNDDGSPSFLFVVLAALDHDGRPYVDLQLPGYSIRLTPSGEKFEIQEIESVTNSGAPTLATVLAGGISTEAWDFNSIKHCFLSYLGISSVSGLNDYIQNFCNLSGTAQDLWDIASHGASCVTGSLTSCGFFAIMVTKFIGCGVSSVVGCVTGGGSNSDQKLNNNQPLSGQSVQRDAWKFYYITVPSGRSLLDVRITGSGDADLYTRFSSKPTASSFVCRPYQSGSNETCKIWNPSSGKWWIGVRGYANGTSSFTIVARY